MCYMNVDQKSAEVLVSTLFFMMTRQASEHDQVLVKSIIDHFDMLENHPDLVNTSLRLTCRRLKKSWALKLKRRDCQCGRSLH